MVILEMADLQFIIKAGFRRQKRAKLSSAFAGCSVAAGVEVTAYDENPHVMYEI